MSGGDPFTPHGADVVVTGLQPAGFAAADALLERGARVLVLDVEAEDGLPARESEQRSERAEILRTLGATVVPVRSDTLEDQRATLAGADLVVVGGREHQDRRVVAALGSDAVDVWSEAELAWRLQPEPRPSWVIMGGVGRRRLPADLCAAMLCRAGRHAVAVGGGDRPVLEQVLHPTPADILVVEQSPWQAGLNRTLSPQVSVCLSLAGGVAALSPDVAAAVHRDAVLACLYALDDPRTEAAVREADVVEGCRAIGVGLGVPAVSALGVVEDVLCDRAFVEQRRTSAAELGTLDDVARTFGGLLAPDLVRIVLAAAGAARALGASAATVRETLQDPQPRPGAPRTLGLTGGLTWVVDDGADTLSAAATAVTAARTDSVWVLDGAADGPDDEVAAVLRGVRPLLRGIVVVDGAGASSLRARLSRHAPDLPVEVVSVPDTDGVPASLRRSHECPSTAAEGAVVDAVRHYVRGLASAGDAVVWAGGTPVRADGESTRWGRSTAAFVDALTGEAAGGSGRAQAGEG